MDIDLVYTYLNGNDEKWIEELNEFAEASKVPRCRFRDNDELKYSLRSVEKYAPWVRRIFIVTNTSLPEWLDVDNPRISIVGHDDIIPTDMLPCYNSNVIEAFLYKIEGLSEVFIYSNDDMFLYNHVSKSFFCKKGKPVVRMIKKNIEEEPGYKKALCNSRDLIYWKYNKRYDYEPIHNMDVYSKEGMRRCNQDFKREFEKVFNNRFRNDDDIERVIFHYYFCVEDMCYFIPYDFYRKQNVIEKIIGRVKRMLHPGADFVFYNIDDFFANDYLQLEFKKHPNLVCLNDSEDTSNDDIRKYKELMAKAFPVKSSFEK